MKWLGFIVHLITKDDEGPLVFDGYSGEALR